MLNKNMLNRILKKIGVTRINSISKYDNLPIWVYQTCRPDSIHLTVDSGKGRTDQEAFIACAVEAIERYTAENVMNERFKVKITEKRLFLPNKNKISISQSIDEVETYVGKEITYKQKVYVPTGYVDYKSPKGSLSSHAYTGTTGLGAHTTMKKAICSGLVEIIERDAIARGRYEKIGPQSVERSQTWINKVLEERSSRYGILRYETEWPLEVVQIICDDPYVSGGMNAMGVGVDLADAVEDAALEAMQTWLMRLAASRDDWAYSRVMDKDLFNEFINAATKINQKMDKLDLRDNKGKYTNIMYEELIKYARSKSRRIVVIPLKSDVKIPDIKIVKVFIENMELLRQGPMMTGIPYMPSYP